MLTLTGGECRLERPWKLDDGHAAITAVLGPELEALRKDGGAMTSDTPLPIHLQQTATDTPAPVDHYALTVAPEAITISAPTEEGLFLGTRTLLQLIEQSMVPIKVPVTGYGQGAYRPGRTPGAIPCLTITDHPRFAWRGMHLDVCRHFFPVEFVKQYIDLLARYKFNTFHWHLTDDQGWRIEIKKYPKLTEVGAWRNGSQVGPYSRREYDTLRYGGFYTQEQVRDVVAYAAARHVTVVPEIEMPGHALAALAAYPQYSCTGGPFEVAKGWGVFPDVFCTKDSTFTFLEGVLDEVLALFPSRYIHMGGDECPHERWKACPRCQAVMQREGLKNGDELQSYFVRRIERYLAGKGRSLIGWDEILQGGLAPNAAVMSWQGTEGGVQAAKAGHPVVMTPGEVCYFDHYQGDATQEPLAIGGYTPIQKVYRFDPTQGLPDSSAAFVLGAQANVWTEYMPEPWNVEYMVLPRMMALAEVLWSPKGQRDEAGFFDRVRAQLPVLDAAHVHYARSMFQVAITPRQGPRHGTLALDMHSDIPGPIVRSCQCLPDPPPPGSPHLSGSTDTPYSDRCDHEAVAKGLPCTARPAPYTGPITLSGSTDVEALMRPADTPSPADPEWRITGGTRRTFRFNKATARPITVSTPPDPRYNEGGPFTLVDGINGGERRTGTEWLGWRKDVTITVDLDSAQQLSSFRLGSWSETWSWIHRPQRVDIATSMDGKKFTLLATVQAPADTMGRVDYGVQERPVRARFVRFTVRQGGPIPPGYPGEGKPAWLFLDEIEVW